ncbi:hypothetical protein K8O61_17160 [Xanthomonas cerealis pv. cerealis]|uniref:hypothetical protein n=1 Tax=Xanthomonas cerealis TaxID=3390025 RepID=UPI001F24F6A4|nr:hypothetical protein [Xanthomonas translucens]UKE69148.1 hypothetical protein K8O61_17160 [Xanthomonas translucens pv. pistacia]
MNGAAEAGSDYAVQAQRFADLHAGRDAQHVAGNLYARIDMLQAGTLSMPVTMNEERAGNAWVCSPRTTYADYAAEEAARLLPRALACITGLFGVEQTLTAPIVGDGLRQPQRLAL